VSTPTKPKTVKEGKAFVNSNIGKRYADGKKTYEITGITNEGEVSIKVTDKIGKSSETTLKLSGTLTNIFGTKKKNAAWSEVEATDLAKKSPNRTETTAKTPKTEQNTPKMEVADKKTARVDEGAKPKTETKPTITPVEAMKKLGTLGAADVDTLTKALAREERAGHTERANMIRVLRDYKRGVGTNSNPQSDETSGGKYRASVEAAKPLDDPAFVAWAKKRGVAPTTQKRNEYDKAMADALANRLGRWIKGVTVKTVNFIAPEEGGDVRAAKAELDGVWKSQRIAKSVEEAGAIAKVEVVNKPLKNQLLKLDGILTGNSVGKLTSKKATHKSISPRLHAIAVANIDTLFESAYTEITHPDTHGRKEVTQTHRLGSLMKDPATGKYIPVMLTVLEYEKYGNRVYSVEAVDLLKYETPAGQLVDSALPAITPRLREFVDSIARRAEEVNGGASSSNIRPLHDGERIVGSYNRATGEVKLAKGASVETVLHELGWHAARHWAEVNADSDPKAANLLKQMKEYAESAPKEIKDAVRDTYGEMSADTLLDEIGAARFARTGSDTVATVNYHSSGSL
jgi:hypothetical protein